MIEQLRLHGHAGSIAWGYRCVADLGQWGIVRRVAPVPRAVPQAKRKSDPTGWQLASLVRWADVYQMTQALKYDDARATDRPVLRFVAPRAGGYWSWPILEPPEIRDGILHARLGQPEH